jgi:hypothetical protein
MSGVLVDANVLLDVLTRDPVWAAWSQGQLDTLAPMAKLVINPIVYAEVAVGFSSIDELDRVLPEALVDREGLPWEAAFAAARTYRIYRDRGGTRRSPLPDFFIGAHAAVRGYRLLTRDAARYRTYFPAVELITPAPS